MPNHVVNEIRLHGIAPAEVSAIASSDRRVIDFEKLVPLPINFWPGSVSRDHEQAFPGTHLDAARKMWGTKWNAYGLDDDSLRQDGDDTLLTFETAWAPPRGWVVAVFSTLKCEITHFWQDEGSDDAHRERYVFSGETLDFPKWETEVIEPGSDDHRRLYKMQWGVETPEELAES